MSIVEVQSHPYRQPWPEGFGGRLVFAEPEEVEKWVARIARKSATGR
jgi:hypothetical protein